MNFKDKLNQIKTVLGMQVSLEQMKLEDGVTVVEAEQFAPEFSIGIVTEEGAVAMPVGEYVLEDGKTLVVAQEGIIAEVKEPDASEEEVVEEEMEVEPVSQPKRVVESVSKETFFAAIEKLTEEIEKLKSVKVEVKEDVQLAAEGPKAIVHNPESQSKKMEFNKRPSTLTSTQQRIYNKLNN